MLGLVVTTAAWFAIATPLSLGLVHPGGGETHVTYETQIGGAVYVRAESTDVSVSTTVPYSFELDTAPLPWPAGRLSFRVAAPPRVPRPARSATRRCAR